MDPTCFYVIREERSRMIIRRHAAPPLEDYVKVVVVEPPSAEFFHTNRVVPPHHRHEDRPPKHFISMRSSSDDTNSYGGAGNWPMDMMITKADYGKQQQLPKINAHAYHQPTVATEVHYRQPPALPYAGHDYYQPTQALPPAKKPGPMVIDCNEAAKLYGGVVINEFGRRNNQLPPVRAFVS